MLNNSFEVKQDKYSYNFSFIHLNAQNFKQIFKHCSEVIGSECIPNFFVIISFIIQQSLIKEWVAIQVKNDHSMVQHPQAIMIVGFESISPEIQQQILNRCTRECIAFIRSYNVHAL